MRVPGSNRLLFALVAGLALSLVGVSGAAHAATSRRPVSWGVYLPDAPPGNLPAVRTLGTSVGKQPGIVMWYPNWGGPWSDVSYARQSADAVLATGAAPMLTWMTRDPGNPYDTTYSNDAIAAGSHDAYLTAFARGMKGTAGPVYIRLDHEMNGGWYPWSPASGGTTSASFIRMWRHVHDVFVHEGATNIKWVWSPNIDCGGCTPMAQVYPGDAYVDWIALDGYNFGTHDGHQWQSFDEVYRASYNEILAIARKPLMLGEIGTVEAGPLAGQTKAAWITDAMSTIQKQYTAIRAFVWFEQNNGVGQDYRISASTADVSAFRRAIAPTVFVSRPPL